MGGRKGGKKSLMGRDTAQQLRGRPIGRQNKSTLSFSLCVWLCPCASCRSSPVVVVCCCLLMLLLLLFTLSLISTHRTWITLLCDLMLLVFLLFSFSFVHFCFVVVERKGNCVMKQRLRRDNKCHGEEIFLVFSNVLYIFVHYLLPNLVLLTPLC